MISEGWYIPTKPRFLPRWVLAATTRGVYYSRGNVKHYECSTKAFQAWLARAEAKFAERQRRAGQPGASHDQ